MSMDAAASGRHTPTAGRYTPHYVFANVVFAAVVFVPIVLRDVQRGYGDLNWPIVILFSVLLVIGECTSAMWIRFGNSSRITPGSALGYSLILLGAPTVSAVLMSGATVFTDLRDGRSWERYVFNASQLASSVALAAWVLIAFGVEGSLADQPELTPMVGLAVVLGATVQAVSNLVFLAGMIAIDTGAQYWPVLWDGLRLSMIAEGALLSLAPIIVIALETTLLLLPLLLVAGVMVFTASLNAHHRKQQANQDPLTKLGNRRLFDEQLSRAVADKDTQPAVLILDLDGFKGINDRLGHEIGDELLISVARRLRGVIPHDSTVARLGGDEFGILVNDAPSDEAAITLANQVQAAVAQRHDVAGFPIAVSASIGVSRPPAAGMAIAKDLLSAADAAMYRSKRRETTVEFAAPADQRVNLGRISLLRDLAEAIGNDELEVAYQPMIDLASGEIDSVEALVRWNHPEHGQVAPGEFIAMAEQTELIERITDLVTRRAMTELQKLTSASPILCVNVAAPTLDHADFVDRVLAISRKTNFPPHRLEIEITERAIVAGSETTATTIARLAEAGVSVAIDDFGTGHASLLTLRALQADRIKIDYRFTTRIAESPADALIVRKVIELAHGLGSRVVAEGVERTELIDHLIEMGCTVGQGHAIAHPMSIDDLVAWADARQADAGDDAEVSAAAADEPDSATVPVNDAAALEVPASELLGR